MGIDCVSLVYYDAGNKVDEVKALVYERLRAELLQPLTTEIAIAELIGGIDLSTAYQLLEDTAPT